MDRERWEQIERLFHAASAVPTPERQRLLANQCSGDDALRREVEELLNQRSSGAFDRTSTIAMPVEGLTIGPYRIEGPLGQGGMGEVFRARDTRLGRPVALKLLAGTMTADSSSLERFRREAQAIAALNHPNVCTVYDIGEHEGRPFLVMELMEGQTLRDRIADRPFSNEDLTAIMVQILEGLEAAHGAGIVHRDIKPANIFLTRLGTVKILDFGLAKSTRTELFESPIPVDSLTTPGTTVGTISYMAPEQLRGEPVDARSDVFACGVLLYEMATGTLPFGGQNMASSIEAVLTRAPRPARELRRDLLPEIEQAIDRALEKDPRMRCQSASEMRAGLLRAKRVLESRSVPAASPPGARSGKWFAAAGTGAALAVAIAGWYFGVYSRRPVTSPSEYVQLTDFSDSASSPSLSPDGRMVTFLRSGSPFVTSGAVYVKLLPDGASTQITNDPRGKYNPVFTPDGSRVAYSTLTRGETEQGAWNTWTVPVTGGSPTLFMKNAAGMTWTGNGGVLFSEVMAGTVLHMGIVTAKESRADERRIYFPEHLRAMAHYSHLSPDGKWLLIVEMDGTGAWLPCRLLPADGGSMGRQIGTGGRCIAAGWSPDGRWMYYNAAVNGAMHLWRQRFPDGTPEQITFGPGEEEGLAVTPDGKSLIASVGVRKSAVWFHDGAGERSISPEGSATGPKVGADGRRVYYLLRKNGSNVNELWSTDTASGMASPSLAGVTMTDFDISTSGREVAFTTRSGREGEIFVAPLDASAAPRLVARGGDLVSFGPPGELVFREVGEKGNYLARVGLNGGTPERVLDQTITEKENVSPSRAWVVAMGLSSSRRGTYAVSLRDGSRKMMCLGPCLPRWSPDGRFLYVTVDTSKIDRTAGGTTLVFTLAPGQELPVLPEGGLGGDSEEKVPRIREGPVEPGSGPETWAFAKSEFFGNLFRIPLH
jgi:serine/threonine protein kinase